MDLGNLREMEIQTIRLRDMPQKRSLNRNHFPVSFCVHRAILLKMDCRVPIVLDGFYCFRIMRVLYADLYMNYMIIVVVLLLEYKNASRPCKKRACQDMKCS